MTSELVDFFKNKKILITGHTGFKGSWLTKILINFGAEVIGYSLPPKTNPSLFEILNLDKEVKNYYEDIRNFDKIKSVIKKEQPEIIFHLAAQPLVRDSYDDPLYTFETNIIGTANILEAIKGAESVRSVIVITTDKVYENKEWIWAYRENDELGGYDPYSTSKACAEFIIRSYMRSFFNVNEYGRTHNTLIASVRAGNVIGGGDWSKDRLVPDIIRALFEGNKTIILRSPESIRPWQHVLEPLLGYLLLSKKLYEGKKEFVGPWNFAPNEENFITVEELVKKGIEILKKGRYLIKRDTKKHESKILKLDATKAKVYLGWKPLLSIEETLKWTFEWYQKYYRGDDIIIFTNKQIIEFFDRWNNARRN